MADADRGHELERIAVAEGVIAQEGSSLDRAARERVAQAFLDKSRAEGELGEAERSLLTCEQLLARLDEDPSSPDRFFLIEALGVRFWALKALGREEESILTLRDLLHRTEMLDASDWARWWTSWGLAQLRDALERAGRPDQARAVNQDLLRRFGDAEGTSLSQRLAYAASLEIRALIKERQTNAAIALTHRLIGRLSTAPDDELATVGWAVTYSVRALIEGTDQRAAFPIETLFTSLFNRAITLATSWLVAPSGWLATRVPERSRRRLLAAVEHASAPLTSTRTVVRRRRAQAAVEAAEALRSRIGEKATAEELAQIAATARMIEGSALFLLGEIRRGFALAGRVEDNPGASARALQELTDRSVSFKTPFTDVLALGSLRLRVDALKDGSPGSARRIYDESVAAAGIQRTLAGRWAARLLRPSAKS